MARIHLDNVSLTFQLRQLARVTFKEFVVRRLFKKSRNPLKEVPALKGLNLEIREGERVGIIGHNGAGKSTLLKVLASIYPPTEGKITVEGNVSSLFEISLGFEQEATGWENIYYRGYLQGETPQSIRPKVQPIAEFSELGHFLDMPVRYYSSGMKVRLAFSIATAIDPEILLIDEVLSVGDMAFQQKARERMQDMMAKARLIVVVSHEMHSIRQLCHRAVWMDHGHIRMTGAPDEVIEAYRRSVGAAPQPQEQNQAA
ncbi:MAG: ABC transporter ATP-binding protein [Gemmataceae bacterium]|nr:ABC transporter ATP-binding protein [Gemmataceae bacterium]